MTQYIAFRHMAQYSGSTPRKFVAIYLRGIMMKKIAVAFAGFTLMFSLTQASFAEKMLSGDEIKALVTNKTVDVTLTNKNKWRQFFANDGSSDRDNGLKSNWYTEGDKHCNTGTSLLCAPIRDNGDGTYSRLKDDGGVAVTWTKIVDGKDF